VIEHGLTSAPTQYRLYDRRGSLTYVRYSHSVDGASQSLPDSLAHRDVTWYHASTRSRSQWWWERRSALRRWWTHCSVNASQNCPFHRQTFAVCRLAIPTTFRTKIRL